MIAAQGILTQTGGTLSHAAVVARGMGKPCIVGATEVQVDVESRRFTVGDTVVAEGDPITIDGLSGAIYLGRVPTVPAERTPEVDRLLDAADEVSRLQVWANADYPRDAVAAFERGARGVGLCRTEHMFMEENRLPVVRAMILARSAADRAKQLAKLLPMQRSDFEGIFRAMKGLPVIIRLIDPPLHEFLPGRDDVLRDVIELRVRGGHARKLAAAEKLLDRIDELREENPMMGLRGCRLSILYPEITRMQVRAILEAAGTVEREGVPVRPDIMVPLVGTVAEFESVRTEVERVATELARDGGKAIAHHVGVMIEVPRAALVAGDIAKAAEFFSFGTNDLTQMTFGYSRDDAERKFIERYVETGILPANPFDTLDDAVVGLMAGAVRDGRASRPDLKIGICGEHGGDPASIAHAHRIGLDYVSCSPYRVPVARLAAAQAALATQ
jgi:pyruvate,orthophosphate dikinase